MGEVPKRVFNVDDPPFLIYHHIEARVSMASFSMSVCHDTPLLYLKDGITYFIIPFPFSSLVLYGLFVFVLLWR